MNSQVWFVALANEQAFRKSLRSQNVQWYLNIKLLTLEKQRNKENTIKLGE